MSSKISSEGTIQMTVRMARGRAITGLQPCPQDAHRACRSLLHPPSSFQLALKNRTIHRGNVWLRCVAESCQCVGLDSSRTYVQFYMYFSLSIMFMLQLHLKQDLQKSSLLPLAHIYTKRLVFLPWVSVCVHTLVFKTVTICLLQP